MFYYIFYFLFMLIEWWLISSYWLKLIHKEHWIKLIISVNRPSVAMITIIQSWFQYSNKEWGNPCEAVCFWGFQYVCQHRNNEHCGQVLGWAEDTHTHTHSCQHFLACLYEKGSSGLLSHFKHSCGHWRCLERTFLSHSGVCSSIKRKTQPLNNLTCLKQRKDEANTLWDTDASENHLYFPFRSCDHLVIHKH